MSRQGSVQITGVPTTPGQNGSVPLRREIRELQNSYPDQFNLFLLGMKAFEALPKEQVTSYFQVAGIHGEPFKAWDGVQGISNWAFGGYCTHSSILFVPWHRPYLCLFEQILYNLIQGIAQRFPSNVRQRYVDAAKQFRLPYFDWAARLRTGESAFPNSMAQALVTVTDVDGARKQIENPLYSFNFAAVRPAPDDFDNRWRRYNRTVRYPDSSGNSRNNMVGQVLTNESASRRSNLALLLLSYTDFDAFSNNEWRGAGNNGSFASLEDVHNEIHDQTGGGGHMGSLETSAFDPLFWLHHSNVDRIWAMWQDLNPNEYLSPRPAPWSTFATAAGTIENENTPLAPFWDQSGRNFWTSVRVKDTKAFGYAYAETQSWTYPDNAAYQRELRLTINRIYGGNVFRNFQQVVAPVTPPNLAALNVASLNLATLNLNAVAAPQLKQPQSASDGVVTAAGAGEKKPAQAPLVQDKQIPSVKVEQPPKPPAEKSGSGSPSGPIPDSLKHLAPGGKYNEWVVNVRAVKHGLNQTFRVLVFDGEFDQNPETWPLQFNVVGRVTVLGRSPETTCGRCQSDRARDLITTGTVPLTSALLQDIQAGRLQNLEPSSVVPYLKENLEWRVTLFDGSEHPVDQVPGLKVSVASMPVTIGQDGIPNYSCDYTTHTEITAGKPGGLGDDDDD